MIKGFILGFSIMFILKVIFFIKDLFWKKKNLEKDVRALEEKHIKLKMRVDFIAKTLGYEEQIIRDTYGDNKKSVEILTKWEEIKKL